IDNYNIHSLPTRRSSDLRYFEEELGGEKVYIAEFRRVEDPDAEDSNWWWVTRMYFEKDGKYVEIVLNNDKLETRKKDIESFIDRSEEHTSELQSREKLVC